MCSVGSLLPCSQCESDLALLLWLGIQPNFRNKNSSQKQWTKKYLVALNGVLLCIETVSKIKNKQNKMMVIDGAPAVA